jgi:hypothetical protein
MIKITFVITTVCEDPVFAPLMTKTEEITMALLLLKQRSSGLNIETMNQ